jgi:alginate biosynthesis protein Alg44
MNAIAQVQVVHESETQRQHARFSMPSRALLNGKEYEVKDLSSGGISLRRFDGDFKKGRQILLELKLPFSKFSFGLTLEAEVQYLNAEKTLGCRFINLGTEQISFLNYVIKSFLAGDIITPGNILNVAARNNFTKPRTHSNRNAASGGIGKQLPGLLLIAAVGFLIAAFIGGNLYNTLLVVKADAATVAGPSVAIRAPQDGVFRMRLDPGMRVVQLNEIIGTLSLAGGSSLTLQSPCSCYISKAFVANGEQATQGQQILSLVPISAKPWVVAEIDPARVKKITPDSVATVNVFGSQTAYTGHVTSMESPLSDARRAGETSVLMKIALDQKIPVDFVNRVASVSFAAY